MGVVPRACVVGLVWLGGFGCSGSEPLEPLPPSFRATEAPSGTSLTVVAHNRIDVFWNDNSPNETAFEIFRATGASGVFAPLVTLGADATSYGDLGLAALTEYCYRVRAVRTTGRRTTVSEFSNTACATTLAPPVPAAPSNLNAKPINSSAVGLTWTDNATDELGFRVELSLDAGATWTPFGGELPPNSTQLSDFSRAPEVPVCYRVSARNAQGSSTPSNVECTAPPQAPDQVTAVGTSAPAIDLTWNDASAVEDGYEIRRAASGQAFAVLAVLPPDAASYHDAAVLGDTRYTYAVAARKDDGYSTFVHVSATAATVPPAAPTATQAVPNTSTSIVVSWTDQSSNEEGFRVEVSTDDGATWATLGTTSAPSFVHAPVTSELRKCYRAAAFNGIGESALSAVACTTPPAAPTGLTAAPAVESIVLEWTDNSGVENGYEVWRFFDNSGCYYYSYYYCYSFWSPIASLPPNTTTFTDSGLVPGQFYNYLVVALKDGGYSDFSNEAGTVPTSAPAPSRAP
ncbi:MAG: fibronectin type III domain-containing protein [Gemmatimonadales bacterium]